VHEKSSDVLAHLPDGERRASVFWSEAGVRYARVFSGVAVLALGVAVVLLSRRLPYHSDYGPGPGFLPTWIGYVLSACAIVVTAQELRAPPTAEEFFRPRTRLAVKVLAAIGVTFLLVPFLGFSLALGLLIGVTMRMMGSHRWLACGVAAAVAAVGIHYVFGRSLDIPLPTGLVGF
jgi:putative tricarboxylic transport membrane protein